MANPLEVMRNKIQLTTDPVPLTDGFLVDYSRLTNNVPIAADFTPGAEVSQTNDRWRSIGITGDPNGNMGQILAHRISTFPGASLNGDERSKINAACNKLTDKINKILSGDGKVGLKDIFANKSQYFNTASSTRSCSGPKDFFRFLFDFAVPPGVNIRSIFETPGAGGGSGQCWNVYPEGCKYTNPPTWEGREQMKCYICDIQLTLSGASKEIDMQCEHLFPFTEAQLFWVLYSNAINPTNEDYKEPLRKIQVREYAPVCADCNCRLKSALGILDLCGNYFSAAEEQRTAIPIVEINMTSVRKIAGEYDHRMPHQDLVSTLGGRINRLKNVFTPLVNAINASFKIRGITTHRELSQFLIYKYLFYINTAVLGKLKVVFAGGENLIKLNQERKKRNTIFGKMLNKIKACMTSRINEETTKTSAATAAATAKTQADKAVATTRSERNRTKLTQKATVAASTAATTSAAKASATTKKNRYRSKLVSFFSKITGWSDSARVNPETIIQDMKDKINNDALGTDYIKLLDLTEGSTLRSELDGLIREDDVSMGGGNGQGKMQQQSQDEELNELFNAAGLPVGGKAPASYDEANELAKALLATTIAMTTLNEDEVDYTLVSSCLNMLNDSLISHDNYSYQNFTQEAEGIKQIFVPPQSGEDGEKMDLDLPVQANICQDSGCEEVNTVIDYLNAIDEDVTAAAAVDDEDYGRYRKIGKIIIDPQTENLSRDIRNEQMNALRQTQMTNYFPTIDFIPPPKKFFLMDDNWPSGISARRCLRCTKEKDTQGYNFNVNTGRPIEPYSKNTQTTRSSVIWGLYNGGTIMNGVSSDMFNSKPAQFCSYCAKNSSLGKLISKENEDDLQAKLNEYTDRFIQHITQQQQERNRESVAYRHRVQGPDRLQRQPLTGAPKYSEMKRPFNTGQSTRVVRSFRHRHETGARKTQQPQNMYGMFGERNTHGVSVPMVQTSSDDEGERSSMSSYDDDDAMGGGKRKKKTKRRRKKKKKTRRKNKRRKKTKRKRKRRKKTRRRR